jgi:hypothetical protein
MNKGVLLIVAGAYLLGLVGAFIAVSVDLWELGPSANIFAEAFVRALVWPYEMYKLLL